MHPVILHGSEGKKGPITPVGNIYALAVFGIFAKNDRERGRYPLRGIGIMPGCISGIFLVLRIRITA